MVSVAASPKGKTANAQPSRRSSLGIAATTRGQPKVIATSAAPSPTEKYPSQTARDNVEPNVCGHHSLKKSVPHAAKRADPTATRPAVINAL